MPSAHSLQATGHRDWVTGVQFVTCVNLQMHGQSVYGGLVGFATSWFGPFTSFKL